MVRSFAAALGMTLLALLCACASATGLRPGPDGTPPSGGLTMLYSQKPEAILEAAIRDLPQIGLHVVEIDPAGRYLLAERGVNATSNGENVGIYLVPGKDGTSVTVVSRRKTPTNVMARDYTLPVHMQLGASLGRQNQPRP